MEEINYIKVNKINLRFLIIIIGLMIAIIGIFFLFPFERTIENIIGTVMVISGLLLSVSGMLGGTIK